MFNLNKKIKQLIKQLSKPRERVSCPLPGHTHLALLLLPLVCAHSFTPTHSLTHPGHTHLALLLPLIHAHSFTPTWLSAGFCSAPLLGHTLCWFLLIPPTWPDFSGLHSCPFQLVCLYQIHS